MEAQVSLTVAFRSSALLGLVSLIFLLTIPLDSLWGSGQASLLANQARNTMVTEPAFGSLWQCGQVPSPAGK